ncbi:hypothetical protein EDB85DRAFT_2064575 [Lactarius pseudohatsudake]|nr:hypothetical protein EDB85DRAFT_2064575 [Lactarius pseudohatsudake]
MYLSILLIVGLVLYGVGFVDEQSTLTLGVFPPGLMQKWLAKREGESNARESRMIFNYEVSRLGSPLPRSYIHTETVYLPMPHVSCPSPKYTTRVRGRGCQQRVALRGQGVAIEGK